MYRIDTSTPFQVTADGSTVPGGCRGRHARDWAGRAGTGGAVRAPWATAGRIVPGRRRSAAGRPVRRTRGRVGTTGRKHRNSRVVQVRADGTLVTMSFGPSALRGFPVTGTGGRVEYRLARNAVVSEFHKGRLSRLDVCDAHPELLRAARNVGAALAEDCPICEETAGRPRDLRLRRRGSRRTGAARPPPPSSPACAGAPTRSSCYVVEVCPKCSWNHLARMYPAGGRHRAAGGACPAGQRLSSTRQRRPVRPARPLPARRSAPLTGPPGKRQGDPDT